MVPKRTLRRNLSRLAGGVFGLLLVLGFAWFVRSMMVGKAAKPWRHVQVVQVIRIDREHDPAALARHARQQLVHRQVVGPDIEQRLARARRSKLSHGRARVAWRAPRR